MVHAENEEKAAVVYAMFVCTYITGVPSINCHVPGDVADTSLIFFDDKEKCERAAAQRNTVWHDKPGATMWVRYVCLDKPPPQAPQ